MPGPAGIVATAAAREAVKRLRAARGHPVMFVQSAGCCAGSVPMCFPAGEFIVGDGDLLLGEIEGCPFYIDSRLYDAWNQAELTLDVAAGDPEGFSLGPGDGLHFVTRSAVCGVPRPADEQNETATPAAAALLARGDDPPDPPRGPRSRPDGPPHARRAPGCASR
jgi:uncharacterized protein (DUF779 family)